MSSSCDLAVNQAMHGAVLALLVTLHHTEPVGGAECLNTSYSNGQQGKKKSGYVEVYQKMSVLLT